MARSDIKFIRVKNGCLVIPMSEEFFKGLEQFHEVFQKECKKCIAESRECGGKIVDCAESCKKIMEEFDNLFGEKACWKTFGDGVVSFTAFSEFFEKLDPLMREWIKI